MSNWMKLKTVQVVQKVKWVGKKTHKSKQPQ